MYVNYVPTKLILVKSKRVKIGNLCQYLLPLPQRRQLFTIFAQYPTFLPICTGDNPLLQSIYAQAAAPPSLFHAFSLLMKMARWVKWPRGGPDKNEPGIELSPTLERVLLQTFISCHQSGNSTVDNNHIIECGQNTAKIGSVSV